MAEQDNVRNRAHELADGIAGNVKTIYAAMTEMSLALGVDPNDIANLVDERLGADTSEAFYRIWSGMFPMAAFSGSDNPMWRVLARLFKDAPKLTDGAGKPVGGQNPALECDVIIRNVGQLHGILSTTPEGTLRIAYPTKDPKTAAPMMGLMYLDIKDLVGVTVAQELPSIAKPRIELATH